MGISDQGSRNAVEVAGPLLAAAAFGAAEQWLSLQRLPFLAAVGGMTAPWLVLPFLAGATFPRRRGHALLGLACAWLAVVACSAGAETGGDYTGHHLAGYLLTSALSHLPELAGAAVGGPLYAVLGHRWRVSRSWLPAIAVTAPVMFEPAVRWLVSQSVLFWPCYPPVAWVETLTGLALTATAVVISVRGGTRAWPGRTRRSGTRQLAGRLASRGGTVAGITVTVAGVVVFCAPPVIPQVYPAGDGTVGVVVTPDGRTAYVGNYPYLSDGGDFPSVPPTLTPVDLSDMRAGTPIEVAPKGWSIEYGLLSTDGRTFYAVVANDHASWVASVDLRTGARSRITVPGGADMIALSPGGQTLYVSDYHDAIVPVATATGQAGRAIPLPGDTVPDASPDRLAVAPDGRTLYVGFAGDSGAEITGIDVATGRALPWAYHPGNLGDLLLAPNGRTLYLSIPGASCNEYLASGTCSLVAISAATGRQAGTPLPLSDDPIGMEATPDGRNLLIIGQTSVTETPLGADGSPTRPVALTEWVDSNTGFAMAQGGSVLYVSVADGSGPGGLSFFRL